MALNAERRQGDYSVWLFLPIVVLCVWLLGGIPKAWGEEPVLRLAGDTESYSLGPFLQILEDQSGKWSIDEVMEPGFSAAFSDIDALTINFGVSSSTYWLRFSIVPLQQDDPVALRDSAWLLDLGWPFFDRTEAYRVVDKAGALEKQIQPIPFSDIFRSTGHPSSEKRGMLAFLPAFSESGQTFYLRLRSDGVFFLHPRIRTAGNYLETSVVRMLWFGLYLGLLAGLLLYNLFLFFCLRDRSYLWYVASVGAMGLYCLGVNRLTFEFFFHFPPTMTLRLSLAALAVSLLARVLFVRCFLQTEVRVPRFDRAAQGLMLLLVAVLLQVPFVPISYLNRSFLLVGGLVPFMLVTAAVLCRLRGYRPARFLVFSWTLYGTAGLVYAGTFQGWLPFHYLTFHSLMIGSALEVILLSLALADRIDLLRRERERLSFSEQRHKELAVTDALTSLYNRRYFESQIGMEIEKADRFGQRLTLMMLDVDNFKQFNDRHGHQEGDRVLTALGRVMMACVRDKDVPCRYGGEEFAIILPGGHNSTAVEIYERINGELEAHHFGSAGSGISRITMSIGVAEHLPGEPAENLVRRADQALYEAKNRGRNQIVIASRDPEAMFFSCFGSPSSGNHPSV